MSNLQVAGDRVAGVIMSSWLLDGVYVAKWITVSKSGCLNGLSSNMVVGAPQSLALQV